MVRSRPVLAALLAMLAACIPAFVGGQPVAIGEGSVVEKVAKLRPGEFVWAPQVAPSGPMLLIVNLQTQRAVLFRNGLPIAASTVSTGRPGYDTPTGVFTVLQKHVEHYSSKYDNAPMPYMQRLTWGGVALHAGKLPGYAASHGCIRLPAEFAKRLYAITKLGMTVVVTKRAAQPRVAPTIQIVADTPADAGTEQVNWSPEKSPTGPVSIIVSSADQRAVVLRNGVEIGSGPVTVQGPVTGTWAYALRNVDEAGQQHWIRVQLSADSVDGAPAVPIAEWQRFHAPEELRKAVASIVTPGTTIVVTADSLKAGSVAQPLTLMDDGPEPGERR